MKSFDSTQRKMLGAANASPANTDNSDQQLSGQETKMPMTYLNAKNHGNSGSQRKHVAYEAPWYKGLGVR